MLVFLLVFPATTFDFCCLSHADRSDDFLDSGGESSEVFASILGVVQSVQRAEL